MNSEGFSYSEPPRFPWAVIVMILFAAFMAMVSRCAAQGESTYWYFGNKAGISWPGPTALTDGQLATTEGCATISTASGSLLFYTDGIRVWNRNHVIMTNGTGLFGHASSTQSAIIVKQPGNTNIYYIFTADADVGPNGICYSVVDMFGSLGMGSVTVKNSPLHTPSCEKLAATPHCNGIDQWVITHDWNSNGFRAFLLTASGVTGPVVSNSGSVISGINQSKYGQLQVSPIGDKILTANYGYVSSGINKLELHDFNNATGIVSGGWTVSNETGVYGCSFSPDGTKIFGATNPGVLMQFDLCAGTRAQITASRYVVYSAGPFMGSIQPGMDGRLYIPRNSLNGLSYIANPNTYGPGCGYCNQCIPTAGRNSGLGTPTFNASVTRSDPPPFTAFAFGCGWVHLTAPVLTDNCASPQTCQWRWSWSGGQAVGSSATAFLGNGTHNIRLTRECLCYDNSRDQMVVLSGGLRPGLIIN